MSSENVEECGAWPKGFPAASLDWPACRLPKGHEDDLHVGRLVSGAPWEFYT